MKIAIIIALLLCGQPAMAQEKVIRIYQDADLSNHHESSWAIQKGIEVAFAEIGNVLEGYQIEYRYLDHRGNVVRSKNNYQEFLEDDRALAIYSGIHSPPLITNRTFINESKALTLVPWAAGSPVTRHPAEENWIFRLSVDDKKAGPFIIKHAINRKRCGRPYLLLEESPWGDSNFESMSMALEKHHIDDFNVSRFGWNIGTQGARIIIRDAKDKGSDCVVLVANAIEGSIIAQAMIEQNFNVPLISHWGITGGNFHQQIDAKKRSSLDISFIQTCFAFTNPEQSDFSNHVFEQLNKLTQGVISSPVDLHSAVGFIHAYDLTRLLISAAKQAGLSGDIDSDRNAIRLALEDLSQPIQGLVKRYDKPYSIFRTFNNTDAHEALDEADYCMAYFGEKDEILIIPRT